ncbi:hypothetical protein HPB49_017253 [Dermacentor silvarum]|uniref:Uncharacterized protein n=1 Tax=Dermacentor silvarum TaxID=543639 RepID=A0ACB8CS92_DERSI|nr:hypothetical protein HPB49_017253 [Dermacentor silvarum]
MSMQDHFVCPCSPTGHLGLPERMGAISDLTRFDAQFFGVHPKQAHKMDPQLRLLLETSYEAIVDSGYDPATLRGRRVGVFIGASDSEMLEALSVDTDKIDGYALAGCCRSMFSNRISFSLDFHGRHRSLFLLPPDKEVWGRDCRGTTFTCESKSHLLFAKASVIFSKAPCMSHVVSRLLKEAVGTEPYNTMDFISKHLPPPAKLILNVLS